MNNGLGDRAISKVVEIGIKSQLDDVKDLAVDIEANPLDIAQGKLDSVTIDGKGMAIKKELKAKRMILHTDEIKIDPLKAALGDIKLEHTTKAEAKLVLAQSDLQKAFNSQFIQEKLKDQQIELDGKKLTVNARNINCNLPDHNTIQLRADIHITELNTSKNIAFTAKAIADCQANRIILKDVKYENSDRNNVILAKALIDTTQEMLDLRNFKLEGMSLQIQRLDIRNNKITISGKAVVKEFPQ